jgi:aspartate/methionine/tyrosine aminotransferase
MSKSIHRYALPGSAQRSSRMDLSLLGVKTVGLPTLPEDGYLPSVSRCEALITTKTKAIVLVTPNNPVSQCIL